MLDRSAGPPSGLTRRTLLQRASIAAAALYLYDPYHATAGTTPAGWGDAEYWAFADRMQPLLDPDWRPSEGAYRIPGGGETSHNANLLYTHAAAARAGQTGACRQDERARQIAVRLCQSPPWQTPAIASAATCASPTATAAELPQDHPGGWGFRLDTTSGQHVVVDTAVIRGLAQAYHARSEIGLTDDQASVIRDHIKRAAYNTFYTYPRLRLNQINWPIEIYAHADSVLGTSHLLRHDCRLQLSHFADALTHPAPGMVSANTGPGYRFHYFPQYGADHPVNLDSAEYATIVCGALLFYGQARSAGMKALSADQVTRMRAWVDRVLCGYWTHGGYLNWDTGLGFARWHQIKKPPLSQQSLVAIALTPRFQPTPAHGRWAKYFFDRGLELFDRLTTDGDQLPPKVMFDVTKTPCGEGDAQLAVARLQANAAQACVYGLSRVHAETPPPLYAFDPDTGRLAITTSAYNTAIVPVNAGCFPYGGVELSRLFDGEQRVAATVGGCPPASFGVVVRDRRTGHETATQRGRPHPNLQHPPLRLTKAPYGVGEHLAAYPRHAYAGAFSTLEAVGSTTGPGVSIHTRHRFRSDHVQTSWRVLPDHERDACDVSVLFPSTGADVVVTATLTSGRQHQLSGSGQVPLRDIAWLHIGGDECGYVVVPATTRLPGYARIMHPHAQSTAPHAGPTVAFELVRDGRLRKLNACVRIAPARGLDEAVDVASALSARA